MARKKPRQPSRSKSASKSTANSRKAGRGKASDQAAIRARGGRFPKGVSGNPGGRPKENEVIKALARQYTEEAMVRLVHWLRSDDPKASVAACKEIFDRGFGRPAQAVTGEDGGPVDVNLVEVRGGIASKLDRIASALEARSIPR